jgi:F0F1-type ATP synthase assembly protein I
MGIGKAKTIVNTLCYGEALKFIVTMVLFISVFQWQGVNPVPLFSGFVVAQLVYWFALARLRA